MNLPEIPKSLKLLPKYEIAKRRARIEERAVERAEKFRNLFKNDNVMKNNSFKTQIINVFNNKNFKTTLDIAKELTGAISKYQVEGNKWTLISTLGSVALKFSEHNEFYIWDYFDDPNEWKQLLSHDFISLISSIVMEYPYEDLIAEDAGCIRIHNVEGFKVGYIANKKNDHRGLHVYVKTEDEASVLEVIKKKVWERFSGTSILMKKNNARLLTASDTVVFEIDTHGENLPSEKADQWAETLKNANELGYSRSILLWGPPGTGKSTMAREIVNKLGYRSFRVRLSDIGGLDESTLVNAIELFEPDAIIFDDLDRSLNQHELLETLEMFHDRLKVVIASANNTNRFERAILRPGRFDEIELVDKLDERVIKKVLGEENVDVFDKVKDWPIVFIEDFAKRCKIMGKEKAEKSIISLARRVEFICERDQRVGQDAWDTFEEKDCFDVKCDECEDIKCDGAEYEYDKQEEEIPSLVEDEIKINDLVKNIGRKLKKPCIKAIKRLAD